MKTAQQIFEALLKARGISDIEQFSKPDYEALGDPMLLPDIDKALARIKQAKDKHETVAIYGDYDVDGMSATSLLLDALNQVGIKAISYIPDRFKDGYGLSQKGIDELAGRGVKLFITVDTGSLSHDLVAYAKAKHGISVIVTDHHEVGDTLPDAVAVINPKRKDSKYPFDQLAGVGVAFALVRAMQVAGFGPAKGQEKWLLDLVALGTVCDIVPLRGENRTLVYWGLKVLAQTKRPGLKKLIEKSGTGLEEITTTTIGFRLGPRLNAAGRLTHAKRSLELLTATDPAVAALAAVELDDLNSERRHKQSIIVEEALAMASRSTDESVHIFVHPEWSHGIVGIVASKLVETTGKPVFILQQLGSLAKGSARSFGEFNLANAIAACQQHIESGGGHAYAAGVTLRMDKLDDFKTAINDYYHNLNLQHQEKFRQLPVDLVLDKLDGLDLDLLELLKDLEPFGTDHEPPLFEIGRLKLDDWRSVGADKKHAKMTLSDSNGNQLDGIGFSLSDGMPAIGSIVCATTALEANTYKNVTKPQLMVKKIELQQPNEND